MASLVTEYGLTHPQDSQGCRNIIQFIESGLDLFCMLSEEARVEFLKSEETKWIGKIATPTVQGRILSVVPITAKELQLQKEERSKGGTRPIYYTKLEVRWNDGTMTYIPTPVNVRKWQESF